LQYTRKRVHSHGARQNCFIVRLFFLLMLVGNALDPEIGARQTQTDFRDRSKSLHSLMWSVCVCPNAFRVHITFQLYHVSRSETFLRPFPLYMHKFGSLEIQLFRMVRTLFHSFVGVLKIWRARPAGGNMSRPRFFELTYFKPNSREQPFSEYSLRNCCRKRNILEASSCILRLRKRNSILLATQYKQ
jgi:hypothetical protein